MKKHSASERFNQNIRFKYKLLIIPAITFFLLFSLSTAPICFIGKKYFTFNFLSKNISSS
jgi:hypothetical protein